VDPGPETPTQLLQAIRRLYEQLQALPTRDRPETNHGQRRGSAAYLRIERQIRALTDRYRRTQEPDHER
jgi:hypothetical protein